MTDLIERLRQEPHPYEKRHGLGITAMEVWHKTACEAADHIEELDKDVNGLIELLRKDRQRIEELKRSIAQLQQVNLANSELIEQLESALKDIVAADHCEGGEYCPHCIARDALQEDIE